MPVSCLIIAYSAANHPLHSRVIIVCQPHDHFLQPRSLATEGPRTATPPGSFDSLVPWHIWKLLASIPSPISPSLLQLFLVANSGKDPLSHGCLQRGRWGRGRETGLILRCAGKAGNPFQTTQGPGESQGQGSLVGCRLWGRIESDTTEAT